MGIEELQQRFFRFQIAEARKETRREMAAGFLCGGHVASIPYEHSYPH
jgi:hypothetical protein